MFKCESSKCGMRLPDIILLLLRVFVGLIFILHGISKATNLSEFSGLLELISIPLPLIMATILAYFEIIGGALLLLGLGVKVIGSLFALEMVAVILAGLLSEKVVLPTISIEYNSLLLLLSVYFAAKAKDVCGISFLWKGKKETPTV
ncbi:MAG: DoxX family protein [Patescibacteria group bacterium]|nr:DoxX family protein [Patescibacteria group bacterium]MDD5490968.1 DoxX family protein [Patescibacteria group bacterium]